MPMAPHGDLGQSTNLLFGPGRNIAPHPVGKRTTLVLGLDADGVVIAVQDGRRTTVCVDVLLNAAVCNHVEVGNGVARLVEPVEQ